MPYAIEKGYPDVAEFLILQGDPINNYREWWQTPVPKGGNDFYYKHPLVTAIRKNYVNLVILIIQSIQDLSKAEEYKDIIIKDYPSFSRLIIGRKHALQIAIEESSASQDMVLALLLAGVDVNMQYTYRIDTQPGPNKYFTPLKDALALQKLDIAQLLLDNNADVEYCGNYNITPLCMVVDDNYIEGVRLLLSYGADPLKRPPGGSLITPLELAMQKEYWDIVDLLLDAAVNENAK